MNLLYCRYVALNTLNKVVSMDTNAVQRHRNIILDCLRDGDISIRRRALELSYALINEQNVRILIRELLAFLEVADDEFKLGLTTQICLAAERFAPNKRWHIDTVLRVLKLVGSCPFYFITEDRHLNLYPGRQFCPRRDPFGIYPPGCTYTGTASIYRLKTIPCTQGGYLTRIADTSCYVDPGRIQRNHRPRRRRRR